MKRMGLIHLIIKT